MSAASRLVDARPWAAAHRTLLVLCTLGVVLAAAAIAVLLLLRGPSAAPAHAPVLHTGLQPAPEPCAIQTIGRPHPC